MDPTTACTACGVEGCDGLFHACLAADFSDPAFGVVHHLVVAAYGLQHGWYPAAAEAEMVAFVHRHLDAPPTDHDRRLIRAVTDGPVQVRTRQPRHREVDWPATVADVDRSDARAYAATVRAWAAAVATALARVRRLE